MNANEQQRTTRATETPEIAVALSNLMAAGIRFSEVETCGDVGCEACVEHAGGSVGIAA